MNYVEVGVDAHQYIRLSCFSSKNSNGYLEYYVNIEHSNIYKEGKLCSFKLTVPEYYALTAGESNLLKTATYSMIIHRNGPAKFEYLYEMNVDLDEDKKRFDLSFELPSVTQQRLVRLSVKNFIIAGFAHQRVFYLKLFLRDEESGKLLKKLQISFSEQEARLLESTSSIMQECIDMMIFD